MAYDRELADRLREVLGTERGVREQPMFGGLAFLVHGNMAVAVSGSGGLLLRIDPGQGEVLLREPHVQRFVMRGRELAGWLWVGPAAVETDAELRRWVGHGMAYARALPPK